MTNTTQSSFAYFVFNFAGILFLVAVVVLVGHLVSSWLRAGSQGRRIIAQEIIWTLVPALVVMGLALMSDSPGGPGRLRIHPPKVMHGPPRESGLRMFLAEGSPNPAMRVEEIR